METVSFRLDGKMALVTGASRGIGTSCAKIMAQAGAKVLATDVLEKEGLVVVEGIRKSGYEAAFEILDVASEKSWEAGVKAALERFGGLDILVNNAGIEIAEAVLFLSSDASRFITGTELTVDGGFTAV